MVRSPRRGDERPVSGDDIVDALLDNMKKGMWRMKKTVFVPAVYNVYLHQDAYDKLDGIRDEVIELARAALTERLASLNQSLLRRFRRAQYKAHAWVVQFLPDYSGDLGTGDIQVSSEFGGAEPMSLVGAVTIRISRTTSRDFTPSEPTASTPSTSGITARPGSATVVAPPVAPVSATPWANIQYRDGGPLQTYLASADAVRIGRGGVVPEVDVLLKPSAISALHLELRHDPATSKSYITDRSMNGTWLNDKRLVKDLETELPLKCEIDLAQKSVVLKIEHTTP